MKRCRNEDGSEPAHAPARVGVYCCACMQSMRAAARRQRAAEAYLRAVEAGSGELWREPRSFDEPPGSGWWD